jgi:type IV pilus assembly protein PilQ
VVATSVVPDAWSAAKIGQPKYHTESGVGILEVEADGEFSYDQSGGVNDKNELIIGLNQVQLAPGASRALETVNFEGPVKRVQAVVGSDPDTVKLVLSLAENITPEISKEGNKLVVRIPFNGAGTTVVAGAESVAPESVADSAAGPVDPGAVDQIPAGANTAAAAGSGNAPLPQELPPPVEAPVAGNAMAQPSEVITPASPIEQFKQSQENRKFVGSPMTLQVRDADVGDVLQLIAQYSGFNILVADNVSGKVTFSLTDVPWDQVLDTVLRSKQLGGERTGNLLRIARAEDLRKEKEDELKAKEITQKAIAKKVAIYPINYADLTKMQTLITPFLSEASAGQAQSNSPTGSSTASDAPFVMADDKTKSLIIRDIPDVLNRVKAVIQELDVPVPQILIEGKVVEVSENFSKGLSGSTAVFGGNSGGGTPFGFAAAGGSIESLLGTSGSEAFAAGGVPQSTFGFEPNLSIIPGFSRLKALLQIEEQEGQSKTIVSPRVVVQNATQATLTDTVPFIAPVVVAATNAQGQASQSQVQTANTNLTVKPTVTNDGNILLEVNLQKSDVKSLGGGSSGAATKNLTTQVYVESGSTLAIGGIYSNDELHNESGFPWLRKIPVLGWFFRGTSDTVSRKELFIFITPRILNPQKLPSELNTDGSGIDGAMLPAPTGAADLKKSRLFAENLAKELK